MHIHTFELRYILSRKKFFAIQEELKREGSKWKRISNGMHYFGLKDNGIQIFLMMVHKKNYHGYACTVRISAYRLLNPGDYVGLFSPTDGDVLEKQYDTCVKEKSPTMPPFRKGKLRRLDFCENVELENQQQVEAYIKLLSRTGIPNGMKPYTKYDEIAKRSKLPKDGFTYLKKSNDDSFEVSLYNKYRQMQSENEAADKQKKPHPFSEEMLKNASSILRVELRCKKHKMKAVCKKYDVESVGDFFDKADDIADELYRKYVAPLFSDGKICTKKEALARVAESAYSPTVKEDLCRYIKSASLLRNTSSATAWMSPSSRRSLTKKLSAIDVNTVIAGRKTSEIFGGNIPTTKDFYNHFGGDAHDCD